MIRKKKINFKRKGKFWAYILECADSTFYTGYTSDLQKRVDLHNAGKGAKYTRGRGPVKLVWSKEYRQSKSASLTEIRIKELTRLQKESLVGGKRLDKVLAEAKK